MTPGLVKRTFEELRDEGPVKADKWRNLWFTKNGKFYIGINEFNSENDAKAAVARCLSRAYIKFVRVRCLNGSFHWDDYSHTIQIPWSGR